jgi:hypothetical protein
MSIMVLSQAQILSAGCLILALLGLAGCGGESRLATVEGKVTIDGQPISSGRVFFRSPDGKSTVIAKIRPDGTYRALDVPYGVMRVTVTPITKWERMRRMQDPKNGKKSRPSEGESEGIDSSTEVPRVIIPEKYQDPDTSGLTFAATSETNTYNIEISSE